MLSSSFGITTPPVLTKNEYISTYSLSDDTESYSSYAAKTYHKCILYGPSGASTNGGVGRRISHDFKNGGVCHERITLNHHFVRRPLFPLLGLFTSVYAPTSIPPTVPESTEKLAAASGRRRWPICWCCLDRGPGSFDVEDATTLSWSSAAVSE